MKTLKELREESKGQTRMLWHSNYWDGPLSGVMLWNGEKMWFEMFEEKYVERLMSDEDWKEWVDYYKEKYNEEPDEDDRIEYDRPRYFKVYKLPEDIMSAIVHNHELFRTYVGTHTDYDLEGNRGRGAIIGSTDMGDLKPYNKHDKFYNAINDKHWLVRFFPWFFKKENLMMSYEWDLKKYEVIGEFEN
jgi:hypothetical protein